MTAQPRSGQDPGVLRAAVLGGVDDSAPASRATRVRPPGRTRGLRALAEEDERAQVDVARGEAAASTTVGWVESMTSAGRSRRSGRR